MTGNLRLNTWSSLISFGRLFARQPLLSLGVLCLTVISMLTESLGLFVLIPLLDTLTLSGSGSGLSEELLGIWKSLGVQSSLSGVLSIFLGLMVVRTLVRLGKDWASVKLTTTIIDDLRNDALTALLQAEWRWLSSQKRGDQTNLILTEVQRVGVGINASLSLMVAVATILAYWSVAIVIEPIFTAFLTGVGAILVAALSGQRSKAMLLGIEQSNVNRAIHENALESFGALKIVKILGREREHIAAFNQAIVKFRYNQLIFAFRSGVSREVFQLAGAMFMVGYVFLGVSFWQVPVSKLIVLVFISARLVPMLASLQQFLHYILNSLPSLKEVQSAIRNAREVAEPLQISSPALIAFEKLIELQNVSVRFPIQAMPALSDISVKLAAGSTTVITGPSGSGKSTLADILMGLLVPDQGRMLIDGAELSGVARISWRRSVSYIPQDVVLYNGTIRENIMRGHPNCSDVDIVAALKAASADFVHSLPSGLNTQIGDGAQGLSGGEKQRIALARGLLRNPSLLVLDEVTSALDFANEAHIVDSVKTMSGSMAVVILGHSTGFLKIADQIMHLSSGRLSPSKDL